MLAYYACHDRELCVLLSSKEVHKLSSQTLEGLLINPNNWYRKHEIYSLTIRLDEEQSRGAITVKHGEGSCTIHVSNQIYESLKREGGVGVFIETGASVILKKAPSNAVDLYAHGA